MSPIAELVWRGPHPIAVGSADQLQNPSSIRVLVPLHSPEVMRQVDSHHQPANEKHTEIWAELESHGMA
jgi:predicted RNA binding protein YcfA (HicA-like mRNA interferase family)